MMKRRLNRNKIIIFLVLILAVICGGLAGAFFALTHDLPQIRLLENFKPDAVTRISVSIPQTKSCCRNYSLRNANPCPWKQFPCF
jgi:membrane carboxypeptidase/penicillin-binding protein